MTLRTRVLSVLVSNVGQLVLGIGTSIVVSRWLGPTGRGEIAAALLWPTLLIYAGSLGLFHAVIFLIAQPNAPLGRVSATGLMLALLHGSIAGAVGLMFVPTLLSRQSPEVVQAAKLLLLIVPLSMIGMCGTNLMLGRMWIHTVSVLRCLVPLGYFIGIVVLCILGQLTLWNLVVLQLALNVMFAVATLLTACLGGMFSGFAIDLRIATKLWRYGSKIHVGSVGSLANQHLAQLILASFAAPARLGLFVVASNTAGMIQMLGQAVQTVTLPTIAAEQNDALRVASLQHIFRRFWNLNLLLLPIIAVMLPPALLIAYGWEFRSAIIPAEILLASFVLLGARDVLVAGAQAQGRPMLGSGVFWLGAVVTAMLLLVLMPRWGILGAAIATMLSAIIQLAVTIFGLRGSNEFHPRTLLRLDLGLASALIRDIRGRALGLRRASATVSGDIV
jgi:O-antigen/teichoic acid export membrane protein